MKTIFLSIEILNKTLNREYLVLSQLIIGLNLFFGQAEVFFPDLKTL